MIDYTGWRAFVPAGLCFFTGALVASHGQATAIFGALVLIFAVAFVAIAWPHFARKH